MQRLRQRDLEASLSYLRTLYAQRDLESFKRHILTTIGSVVPAESVIYVDPSVSVTVDDQAGGASAWESEPAFSSPDLTEIVEIHSSYIDENPLINHYRRTFDGQAVKITDFLTRSEFRRLGLYNDIFRRVGLDQWMTIVLPHGSNAATAVSLGRSGKDFSERDRLALNLLRPHLLQAHDNTAALTQVQQESIRMKQTMEKLDRSVIVLGKGGRLQWCTERAERWIAEYFGPAQDADHLPDDLRRWVEHQMSAPVRERDILLPQYPLVTKRAGKRLLVRFVADNLETYHLLILEEQYIGLSAESLKSSLGLTNREAEILLGIAQGKTNKAIAEDLYVSPLTVKTHLQRSYRKLGVESRAEALSRALLERLD
jgi:DNA-binding CsgD family transcriptional regulator